MGDRRTKKYRLKIAYAGKLSPGMSIGQLTPKQVRMVLRIYWTDQYTRRAEGFTRGTRGLIKRLAFQSDVSADTIEKITVLTNDPAKRTRYKTVSLTTIKRLVKLRLRTRGIIQ